MFNILKNRKRSSNLPSKKTTGLSLGLATAGIAWWLFGRRRKQHSSPKTGQQPVRSHIRLSSHPARTENPV